ncbi:HAMP domain-containing sensor histidine kinase [Streptomyces sp. NBC_01497]|uniref:HAMP domain-containing sensor histidine kinase n=1 Tax=Streptomyces sp. NBC_01497 TaxID=2903885 RepID=UPI002E32EB22|nr:HAMP domain-containing sensor histidine kinase [Streptomyces sp. NBC_01497]
MRAVGARFLLALRGLRFRLVVGFVLVAVASALSTGALAFREARTGVLQQSQDTVIRQFRDRIDELAPSFASPPSEQEMQSVVDDLARGSRPQGWHVLATYGRLRAGSDPPGTFDVLSPALRASVRTERNAVFQRVDDRGHPVLVVGLPVTYGADRRLSLVSSGLVFYLVVPQNTEQAYVSAMVGAIKDAALWSLLPAVVVALVASRGVLRPVRALRGATRLMAQGHLDVRLSVDGSDELADLSRSFNETAAALEHSVAELRRLESQARRFVADVSHELRTPLAAMAAVTDVLDDASHLDGTTADAVRLVSQETVRLTRLVADLMEISRFDAGAAVLNPDEIDLADSVRNSLSSRGWQDRVRVEVTTPGPLRIRVDPRRLDVVTANIVGNALRHGAPPVLLRLELREGHEDLSGPRAEPGGAGRPRAVMEVSDGGPGIADADLPHIFERFYKADATRTRSESSGLGLAITAENVRLHGGRLTVANRPGAGAVFTVELPLCPDPDADTAAGPGSGHRPGPGPDVGPGSGSLAGDGSGDEPGRERA